MADLASTAVTVNARWDTVASGNVKRQVVDATLVLTGQGGASNKITASVLGLRAVDAVLSCQADGDTTVHAEPNYARSAILLYAYNSASAADATDTIRVVVMGKPRLQ